VYAAGLKPRVRPSDAQAEDLDAGGEQRREAAVSTLPVVAQRVRVSRAVQEHVAGCKQFSFLVMACSCDQEPVTVDWIRSLQQYKTGSCNVHVVLISRAVLIWVCITALCATDVRRML
jgi:hypothetical protein